MLPSKSASPNQQALHPVRDLDQKLRWTASQVMQWVKALAAKLDDLSSLPGTHGGELIPGSRPLTATHAVASGHCPCVPVHACAHTN